MSALVLGASTALRPCAAAALGGTAALAALEGWQGELSVQHLGVQVSREPCAHAAAGHV
jgi:hypothetical protein